MATNAEGLQVRRRKEYSLRLYENRVVTGIQGLNRNEVTGGWRKLHSEKLHNLCSSLNFSREIKSRMIRWKGHVASMGTGKMRTKLWLVSLKVRDHSRNLEVIGV
jgi:hypothetical protein